MLCVAMAYNELDLENIADEIEQLGLSDNTRNLQPLSP